MQSRKLIDDLALYQRGIHVKREQAAVASIYAFALKRYVNVAPLRNHHKFRAQRGRRVLFPADFQLNARIRVLNPPGERQAPGQPFYAVDVELVFGDRGADSGKLPGSDLPSENADDKTKFPLRPHPVLERGFAYRRELDFEVQFVSSNDEVFLQRSKFPAGGNFDEDSQSQSFMHNRLADIENTNIVLRKNARE